MLRLHRMYKRRPNTTDMSGILTRVEAANQAVHKERENFCENVPRKEPDSDSTDVGGDVILYVYAELKIGGPIARAFSLERRPLSGRRGLGHISRCAITKIPDSCSASE